jgi:microcystin-dependent protein
MATLTIGYTFVNATPAVASQVNANFQDVKTFVEGISAGTNIDAGSIELSKLSNTAIQNLTPSGSIMQYAGAAAPTGWIICDGAAVSTTTYAALFAVIGTAFNTSGGQTAPGAGTFRVPLLTGRIPVGRDAANAAFDVVGETGGSATSVASHTHSGSTLTAVSGGSHTHTYAGTTNAESQDHVHAPLVTGFALAAGGTSVVATGPGGGADAAYNTAGKSTTHNHTYSGTTVSHTNHDHTVSGNTGAASAEATNGNLQPYIVVNYIIKA